MLAVRFHGRGGQGVVTSAELLSVAAFLDDRHAQAFPSFGSERTGAPVVAFCRVTDAPIRSHEPVARPDAVVVQDPTLLQMIDVFDGLAPSGYALVNSSRSAAELGLAGLSARLPAGHLRTVPATELAREHLGRPMPGAPLLGALAALTGVVSPASLEIAIGQRFAGSVARGNAAAARAAHRLVAGAVHA
jgi:pyruvate ferredoxin oxidoreductase gamma subunit